MAIAAESETTQRSRERVELILGHLDQLPPLPAVVVRLLSVTASDDCSARDVVRVLEMDSSMTATVLRLARRSDTGIDAKGLTITRAVTALGLRTVRNAVVAGITFQGLPNRQDSTTPNDTATQIWKHNLATACCAQALADRTSLELSAGDAFVCGLLHDVGKLALGACLPKSYARVIEESNRRRECICDVERRLLGLDHTAAGKRLLTRWRLPQPIWECAWLHHQSPDALPSTVEFPNMVALVHLADNLVRRQRIGFSGYHHIADLEACALHFGLTQSDLDECAASLPDQMEPFLTLIGLDQEDSNHLYIESLAKANLELAQTNARLSESNDRLATRSLAFELLSDLAQHLGDHDQVGDVCGAVAGSLQKALDCPAVLVLGAGSSATCTYFAVARDHEGSHTFAASPAVDSGIIHDAHNSFERSNADLPVPANAQDRSLWATHIGPEVPAELLSWPLRVAGVVVGVALFDAGRRGLNITRMHDDGCAVSSSFGLAIANARSRVGAELLSDELLELNRRFRAAESELLRSRSMSMIAKMAAGAAHELNTPLSVISGRAQMLQAKVQDSQVQRWLQIIEEQVREASGIVTDLMNFAKPPAPSPTQILLADVCEALRQHWQPQFDSARVKLQLDRPQANLAVRVDARHLRTMLDAVVANALNVLPPETGCLHINSPSRASDEKVRIVCEDNGPGMSHEVLEHAIDPFFSHRPAGRGRGLGLSRAHRLAEINGGALWIQSTQNLGTTVTIELPADSAPR